MSLDCINNGKKTSLGPRRDSVEHCSTQQGSLSASLIHWSRRSGSTVFVLTSALKNIGRLDCVGDVVQEMKKMHTMQLYVVVEEVDALGSGHGEPQFFTLSCSCETSLKSALENFLGGDLTLYQIMGPGPWVTWNTEAKELKGQQLTLRRFPSPQPHARAQVYGPSSEIRRLPTMPQNIRGLDSNYDTHQPSKIWEPKMKITTSSDSISSYSDNNLIDSDLSSPEGIPELKPQQEVPMAGYPAPSFSTLTLSVQESQAALEETHPKVPCSDNLTGDDTQPKVLYQSDSDAMQSPSNWDPEKPVPSSKTVINDVESSCSDRDTGLPEGNLPALSLLRPSFISTDTNRNGTSGPSGDWNMGSEAAQLMKQNDLGREQTSQCVQAISKNYFDSKVEASQCMPPGLMDFDDGSRSSMDTNDDSLKPENNSGGVEDCGVPPSGTNVLSDPIPRHNNNMAHCVGISAQEQTGEYVAHSMIPTLVTTEKDNSGVKRNNLQSPYSSPTAVRTKRHCPVAPPSASEASVSVAQHLSALANAPESFNPAPSQPDGPNVTKPSVKSSVAPSGGSATSGQSPMPQVPERPRPCPPQTDHNVHYENQEQIDLQIAQSQQLSRASPPMSVSVSMQMHKLDGSGDMREYNHPLMCHTPPPPFSEEVSKRDRSSSEPPSVMERDSAKIKAMIDSDTPTARPSPAEPRYGNTDVFFDDDIAVMTETRMFVGTQQPSGSGHVQGGPEYMAMSVPAPTAGHRTQTGTPPPPSVPPPPLPAQQPWLVRQNAVAPGPAVRPPFPHIRAPVTHASDLYITPVDSVQTYTRPPLTRSQTDSGPGDLNGHYVYDEPIPEEEERRLNYPGTAHASRSMSMPVILNPGQAPPPPPRIPSLEGQLSQIPGWSPDVNGSNIQTTMRNYQGEDGNFIVWRSRRYNQFVITVSHLRELVHYFVLEERLPNHRTVYFLYRGGFRSESFLDLVRHYIAHGMRMPVSPDRTSGGTKYYMDHVRLRRPLIVRVQPRGQGKGNSKR
ncbi:uncharacterized protein LOC101845460 isoform X2 [Aplysia californica]|uniref:Uncharacterized protein LOC101845460 isoform X2 n=1 Tax=Aplysia californica TaxID=6500 RepID=A0ABM0ZXK5_APLCA|nr:uncharacterized protein LOC101845460 isoform X2 [Aplysia californica]